MPLFYDTRNPIGVVVAWARVGKIDTTVIQNMQLSILDHMIKAQAKWGQNVVAADETVEAILNQDWKDFQAFKNKVPVAVTKGINKTYILKMPRNKLDIESMTYDIVLHVSNNMEQTLHGMFDPQTAIQGPQQFIKEFKDTITNRMKKAKNWRDIPGPDRYGQIYPANKKNLRAVVDLKKFKNIGVSDNDFVQPEDTAIEVPGDIGLVLVYPMGDDIFEFELADGRKFKLALYRKPYKKDYIREQIRYFMQNNELTTEAVKFNNKWLPYHDEDAADPYSYIDDLRRLSKVKSNVKRTLPGIPKVDKTKAPKVKKRAVLVRDDTDPSLARIFDMED